MKAFSITAVALLAVLAAGGVTGAAAKEEPTVYVVKKGDTLWGLSDRFIKDPHYWPNLWATNPDDIRNPHFIFPGQRLRIFPDRIEIEPPAKPQPATAAAPVAEPAAAPAAEPRKVEEPEKVVPERTYTVTGGEGFLATASFKPVGKVIAGQHNRRIYAADDVVYTDIGNRKDGQVGNRYAIYKQYGTVSHPVSNQVLGYRVAPLGVLQLTEIAEKSSKALVTESYLEIEPNAALLPYTGSKRKEVALRAPDRDLTGYIVETRTGTQAVSVGDVAYIDLGEKQGVKPGNVFYVVRKIKVDIDYFSNKDYDLPVDVLGALLVVETAENTATAIVIKGIDTIYRGDRLEMKKGR